MKKKIVVGGIVVAIAAVAAITVPRALKKNAPVEAAALPVVDVQTPETGTIELFRELVGSVEPSDVVYIYPPAPLPGTSSHSALSDFLNRGISDSDSFSPPQIFHPPSHQTAESVLW